VTGLWTNDRDTLAGAIRERLYASPGSIADYAIQTGAVRVLDPDDPALVEQVAREMWAAHSGGLVWDTRAPKEPWMCMARAAIVALRQP
jgi:hypothetical protein